MQGLYLKFTRQVDLSDMIDRIYMNLRPDIKQHVRRREIRDLDDLASLATDVERMLESIKIERLPPKPDDSFFPEFAYSEKTNPKPNPTKVKLEPEIVLSKMTEALNNFLAKLNKPVVNSNQNKGGNSNNSGSNKSGSNNTNKPKNQRKTFREPKPQPPCYNCGKADHPWKECKDQWVKFCHICGKHGFTKFDCDSDHCQGN